MQQRTIAAVLVIFILGLFAMSFGDSANNVTGAATDDSVWDKAGTFLEKYFGGFHKFSREEQATVLKVLLAIILFAVLYGVQQKTDVFKSMGKNVNVAISVCIAILATVLIPPDLVVGIAASYGIVFYSLMLTALIGGGLFVVYAFTEEPTAINQAMKAGFWFIVSVVCAHMAGSFKGGSTVDVGLTAAGRGIGQAFSTIQNGFELATALALFVSIYYLWQAISWNAESRARAEADVGPLGGGGGGGGFFATRLRRARNRLGGGLAIPNQFIDARRLSADLATIDAQAELARSQMAAGAPTTDAQVQGALNRIRSLAPNAERYLDDIEDAESVINAKIPDLTGTTQTQVQTRLTRINNIRTDAAANALTAQLNDIVNATRAPAEPSDEGEWRVVRDAAKRARTLFEQARQAAEWIKNKV